ncbi:putative aminopeptidase [Armadillidium nasatum]|uniref:Putative aminopeptidase n=1 Tax=Armadillidium nasatum TaxID=96803 RepID=A0A5N5T249_9CRUS|nr:putative aminopeptidase [Armadillidium nasatum]
MSLIDIRAESKISAEGYDGIIFVASSITDITAPFKPLYAPLREQSEIDNSIEKVCSIVGVDLPCKRLIYSPTGPLDRDTDDVRRFSDAAATGVKRALKAGVQNPLLAVIPCKEYPLSELVTLLGALQALYVPLEIREGVPNSAKKVEKLGFVGKRHVVDLAIALENGRTVARDIGGSDPERMAPPKVEEYVRNTFNGSDITVEAITDEGQLNDAYPLFSAVNRCAKGVDRHKGRVIILTYKGKGPIEKTLMLVGKGVTYDTGGADIKAGGVMAGMHRDKCGAAAVAGFMEILKKLRPPNIKVIGAMSVVRNSVGSDCYVSDEIIVSRAGVRIRVGNTDAEGRMAMADVLCQMKEEALKEVNPHLFTIATLTGHCVLTYGESYSAIMDNGPSRKENIANNIQVAGDLIADPFEISTIRREDFEFHAGKSEYEDVLQSNNLPSTRTTRGHQTPAAFLILASGLDKYFSG